MQADVKMNVTKAFLIHTQCTTYLVKYTKFTDMRVVQIHKFTVRAMLFDNCA